MAEHGGKRTTVENKEEEAFTSKLTDLSKNTKTLMKTHEDKIKDIQAELSNHKKSYAATVGGDTSPQQTKNIDEMKKNSMSRLGGFPSGNNNRVLKVSRYMVVLRWRTILWQR